MTQDQHIQNAVSQLGDTPTERILTMMARLRDKQTGCPWDIEQDFSTIAPYTIEEAYEVADAIERGDMVDLKEELGDLLLQVVFHAQIASELIDSELVDSELEDKQLANNKTGFDFNAVADGLVEKMVRRHPHVFGDEKQRDANSQTAAWEVQKAAERAAKGKAEDTSILAGIALGLPALMRAEKLQKRAARVGFDWPDILPVLDKINEESREIVDARDQGESQDRLEEEVGDLLFAVTNLARHLKVDPEVALRKANSKFTRRFNDIETSLAAKGESVKGQGLTKLDALWDAAKAKGL